MGELIELEEVLRSKTNREKITPQEELVLETCKSKAVRDFTVGFCVSSAAVWAATRRLRQALRFNLSLGSATFFGLWRLDRSLDASRDQILEIEGSRIQRELANIILRKHADDTSRVKLVSKHFYPEQVFSDLNPDKPIFRWRARNIYIDSTGSQRTLSMEDSGNHDKHDVEPKQYTTQSSLVGDMIADPLDCIFGYPESIKENTRSGNIGVPHRRHLRAHKKANRRRAHHSDGSDSNTS